MTRDRVTAVFATYNSAHLIGCSLAAIPDGIRCIVVDNASRDDTCEVARSARSDANIIRNSSNQGFGRACNAGLHLVETDYAVLINPDLFVAPSCIDLCISAADKHSEFAILGCDLKNGERFAFAQGEKEGQVVETNNIWGAFMFMRMSVFCKIGFFDENIFMYSEDQDLCLRTTLAGYKLGVVLGAHAHHMGGSSTSPRFDNALEKARVRGHSTAYIAEKYRGHPAGRAAAKKQARYLLKSVLKTLILDVCAAKHYRSLLIGMREFQRYGPSVMFQNKFVK